MSSGVIRETASSLEMRRSFTKSCAMRKAAWGERLPERHWRCTADRARR